ncbi:Aminopeptidase, partial [Caligus rogercresseyi]
MKPEFKRLSSNAVPSHYDLFLRPVYGDWKTHGTVSVHFKLLAPSNVLELNALDMEVTSAKIRDGPKSTSTELNAELQVLKILFPEGALSPGEHVLEMEFISELSTSLKGFYRCQSASETILCTQFESTSARSCFPCWDEPAIKATF